MLELLHEAAISDWRKKNGWQIGSSCDHDWDSTPLQVQPPENHETVSDLPMLFMEC
jgi:hypothetical protein